MSTSLPKRLSACRQLNAPWLFGPSTNSRVPAPQFVHTLPNVCAIMTTLPAKLTQTYGISPWSDLTAASTTTPTSYTMLTTFCASTILPCCYLPLKPTSVNNPDIYIGAKVWLDQLTNGVFAWSLSPLKYVQQEVLNCKKHLRDHWNGCLQLPTHAPGISYFVWVHCNHCQDNTLSNCWGMSLLLQNSIIIMWPQSGCLDEVLWTHWKKYWSV